MRTIAIWMLAAVVMGGLPALAGAQVPVTGVSNTSLQDLEGTDTPVTVVLKNGAQDSNCRIVHADDRLLTVISANGERNPYLMKDVQEIRVQEGKVEEKPFQLSSKRALSSIQKGYFEEANRRAQEIFDAATDNQTMRMNAAAILVFNNNTEARDYLANLIEANDLRTALEAIMRMYVAGEDISGYAQIQDGLDHGDLNIRRLAIVLAGASGNTGYINALTTHADSARAEIAAPAIKALARLGHDAVVPQALNQLGSVNRELREAAVFALVELGDESTVETLWNRVEASELYERYNIARVLYHLDGQEASGLLYDQMRNVPTVARPAGIILASHGEYEARVWLDDELAERYDTTRRNILCRAEMTAALVQGGNRRSISIFQELLREEEPWILEAALAHITLIGEPFLMTVAVPLVQNPNHSVATAACQAVMACADTGFKERLTVSWFRENLTGHCSL